MSIDIPRASLVELTAALRDKRVSAGEVMSVVLGRIDATHADLNAVVALRDRDALLAEARAADARLARGDGRPLEGVPLGVKDLEDVGGMITSEGSIPFREHVAERDSVQVERLRNAAIAAGERTRLSLAQSDHQEPQHAGKRSPWDDHPDAELSGGGATLIGLR
jgi:amidase